jgi:hypothetical protein
LLLAGVPLGDEEVEGLLLSVGAEVGELDRVGPVEIEGISVSALFLPFLPLPLLFFPLFSDALSEDFLPFLPLAGEPLGDEEVDGLLLSVGAEVGEEVDGLLLTVGAEVGELDRVGPVEIEGISVSALFLPFLPLPPLPLLLFPLRMRLDPRTLASPISVISASCKEREESELAVNSTCEFCMVASGIWRLLSPLPLLYATPVRTSIKVATPTTSAIVRLRVCSVPSILLVVF